MVSTLFTATPPWHDQTLTLFIVAFYFSFLLFIFKILRNNTPYHRPLSFSSNNTNFFLTFFNYFDPISIAIQRNNNTNHHGITDTTFILANFHQPRATRSITKMSRAPRANNRIPLRQFPFPISILPVNKCKLPRPVEGFGPSVPRNFRVPLCHYELRSEEAKQQWRRRRRRSKLPIRKLTSHSSLGGESKNPRKREGVN